MNKSYFPFLSSVVILLFIIVGCGGFSKVRVDEINQDYELVIPESKLVMMVPKTGFQYKNINVGGGTANPGYFYFENIADGIILSGWFEPQKKFKGIEKYWEDQVNAYKKRGLPSPMDVAFDKIGDWNAIFYDTGTSGYRTSNLSAHLIQSGTWIDLHISTTSNTSNTSGIDARYKIIDQLKAIKIKEKE
jgi:hypothetical protein